jgi:NAD(P)-dependent dehydrogenase (short-subunit alcohol dehydrogenase family)
LAEETVHQSQFAKYPALQDRVVLITGGAAGIGEKLVEAFTLQRAQVVFLDIADQASAALIDRLTPNAAHAPNYVHCDLADSNRLAEKLAWVIARFGTIDIVIRNTGATEEVTGTFSNRCEAADRKHQRFISQATVPGMKWQGRGVILNMSYLASGHAAYVASRNAIVDLTRTLARELRPHDVRVQCMLPGAVETARERRIGYSRPARQTETKAARRMLQPEDVTRLVLFLSSGDAADIDSQIDATDGGWI